MSRWVAVCTTGQLIPERGVAVLVHETPVAIFRIRDGADEYVRAVGHRDPFSGAHVIARGILGSVGARDTVASPMYKHVFDLATGECLTDPSVRLPVHRTFVAGNVVYVEASPLPVGTAVLATERTAV